jgi:hypothetical protein
LGGVGGKLIIGGDVSVGIAWDDNGNYALALSGGVGVGIEAEVKLPSLAINILKGTNLNELKGIGVFKVDGTASVNGTETNVGIGFGISIDNETSEITGCNSGIIGGGVTFASGSIYTMLKHGIGGLVEQYNKLDSASQKEFIQEIRESNQMPAEMKEQILSTVEEQNQ